MTAPPPSRRPRSAKIVVAGGFGVGKSTLVGTLSEIPPLTTETSIPAAGPRADGTPARAAKTTTTVALDFGRVTINDQMVLYLFGTPGQDRFGFLWDDLAVGALGAVVLVDPRRFDDCHPAIDFFESHHVPFLVAVNRFDGGPAPEPAEVREALGLAPEHPVVECDARYEEAVKAVVLGLLELLIEQFRTRRQSGARKAVR